MGHTEDSDAVDNELMLRHALSRRSLLRGAALAGLSLPFASLLASCGGDDDDGDTGGPGSSSPTGSTAAQAAAFTGMLQMTAWEAYPDQIREHLEIFKTQSGTGVELSLIPNVGYGPAIQTRLQGGDEIDAYYNFAYNSTKFVEAGWASELNGLPGVDDMLADMFPSSVDRHKLPDGRIVSVPYFSAVHLLLYNQQQIADAGFSAAPASRSELYDQCEALKAAGVSSPYAAYWTKGFVEEYFIHYLVGEGIVPFDDDGKPTFQDDPKTLEVMEWWTAMFQDGLTAESILTDDPGQHVAAMAQGNSAFYELHHYFLKDVRSTEGPESENVTLSYRAPGSVGASLHIGEVVQMGAIDDPARRDAAWELMKHYGWKDENDRYGTFIAWAEAAALLAPYPGLFEDPDFRAAFPDYYDLDALQGSLESSEVVPARVLPWYSSFQTKLGDRIHAMLLGQASAQDTIDTLVDDATGFANAN